MIWARHWWGCTDFGCGTAGCRYNKQWQAKQRLGVHAKPKNLINRDSLSVEAQKDARMAALYACTSLPHVPEIAALYTRPSLPHVSECRCIRVSVCRCISVSACRRVGMLLFHLINIFERAITL